MIYNEILVWHSDAPATAPADYTQASELLVGSPYDTLYTDYLDAQISMHNMDFERYQNAMIRFNNMLSAYADHINRTCLPLQPNSISFSY